ncbi:aromatic ring-hydroxylating dioxygenase subunit alpha [Sphingobium sp. HWE2-09]|uniref:aromatic ring-hydroxylating dioxygenase subunit alpha n=1 Tax=Sphingobium sp. HWE2-09 TaxID=3108390 RepID=UPI002DCCA662|nr:aromatic ring-hydroxylating dioxygenase subunit alpha [Sphingobium sp. HWE2-09]
MTYVRNAWYVASWTQDLEPEKPVATSILGEPIVLLRTATGRIVALEDRCVHRLAPLSLGRCEGENLRCLYHGLLFDPAGRVVEIPGQDMIPAQARVRSYPVEDRHSWIWVWMGDPARADPALIPPAVGFDDPHYILGRGQLDYAAEARLINDNLLDFSHLSYVHANSFGATEDWAKNRPQVIPLDRGVRVQRWLTAQPGMKSRPGADEPRDRFSTYDFLIPGVLLMTGGSFPIGTADALGHAPPDLAQAESGVTFTSQAVTPMADGKARYFFSWGPHRDHGDAALRDILMTIADQAFAEDRTIIEAQQRVIDGTADPRIMPTTADKAVILFSRLVDKLARAESGEGERTAA